MSHLNANASSFLVDNYGLFDNLQIGNGVLDLACGKGRNGLFLVSHNVPILFADNNEAQLQTIEPALESLGTRAKKSACWLIDFEAEVSAGRNPLAGKSFDAVIVFNYLHRPLFPFIKEAIRPGGLIVYETFTVNQNLTKLKQTKVSCTVAVRAVTKSLLQKRDKILLRLLLDTQRKLTKKSMVQEQETLVLSF